ncbi:putative lipid-transfer protein DIR1, partial [Camellia sinensis]|uniref:putative lipid-transfer protein DIR1 n=1 Tax=Camellia sinensis TaxID=4442 RepID=UPI00103565B2
KSNHFTIMLLFVVVMVGLVEQGKGQNCGSTFFSALVQLIPCRAAVAPFSPIPPSEACCTAIKSLGQPCLCVLINGPPITGVDRNMALQLPEKCVANFEPCKSLSLSGLWYWEVKVQEEQIIPGNTCE